MSKVEQKPDKIMEILQLLDAIKDGYTALDGWRGLTVQRIERVRQFVIRVQEAIRAIEAERMGCVRTDFLGRYIDGLGFAVDKIKALGEEST